MFPATRIRMLLLPILLFFGSAASALAEKPDEGAAFVFAGKVAPDGSWTEQRFDGLPAKLDALSPEAPLAIHIECANQITAREGTKVHIEASPRAPEIARIKRGEAVTCTEIVVRYGFVWASVRYTASHAAATESRDSDNVVLLYPVRSGCAPGDQRARPQRV